MLDKISQTRTSFDNDLAKVTDLKSLEELRIKYLSRKGSVSILVEEFKDVPREEKKSVGQALNEMKIHLQGNFNSLKEKLEQESKSEKDEIDLTLPGRVQQLGSKHIITQTLDEIKSIFITIDKRARA